MELAGLLFPDPAERRKLFCDTPRRLFGFDGV
jgi:predicted TIM-barrel fold metal-dependent hydrolase